MGIILGSINSGVKKIFAKIFLIKICDTQLYMFIKWEYFADRIFCEKIFNHKIVKSIENEGLDFPPKFEFPAIFKNLKFVMGNDFWDVDFPPYDLEKFLIKICDPRNSYFIIQYILRIPIFCEKFL